MAPISRSQGLLFLLLVVASSCFYDKKAFNFSEQERNLLAIFKKGDTLYFDGSDMKTDTVVILGSDSSQKRETGWIMAQPAYNEIWVTAKCLPGTDTSNLITITRYPQTNKVEYYFSYRHFIDNATADLRRLHSDTLDLNRLRVTNYSRIGTTLGDSAAAADIEYLYWTAPAGLVGYKYHNGTTYGRRAL